MSAAPKPYTVTSKRFRKGCAPGYWDETIVQRENGATVFTCDVLNMDPKVNAKVWQDALNDAYQAGVKAGTGYESTLPPDTPERRAAMAKWAAERCAPSPIPITPETTVPYPCWLLHRFQGWVKSGVPDRPLVMIHFTHYLPDQPEKPTVVPTS